MAVRWYRAARGAPVVWPVREESEQEAGEAAAAHHVPRLGRCRFAWVMLLIKPGAKPRVRGCIRCTEEAWVDAS
ncbi:hypothetical protein HaLaN_23169, partial [Haematococcus lacustris]